MSTNFEAAKHLLQTETKLQVHLRGGEVLNEPLAAFDSIGLSFITDAEGRIFVPWTAVEYIRYGA